LLLGLFVFPAWSFIQRECTVRSVHPSLLHCLAIILAVYIYLLCSHHESLHSHTVLMCFSQLGHLQPSIQYPRPRHLLTGSIQQHTAVPSPPAESFFSCFCPYLFQISQRSLSFSLRCCILFCVHALPTFHCGLPFYILHPLFQLSYPLISRSANTG